MISLFATTACNDEYLNTEPSEFISAPEAQYIVNGMYTMMVNDGTGGTTDHDDFGQKGYDIYSDLLSSDMVLGGVTYGWYSNIANLSDPINFTRNTNYKPWRYYYRLITTANDVIAKLGGNDAIPPSDENRHAMGQAKALRAYAYFYLLQFYTNKYDASADSIPLYTEAGTNPAPLSKQSEVYDLIINDLSTAITLLNDFSRTNKGMINKFVAEGLLTYAYAAKGDYANVATHASNIINTSGYPITSSQEALGGFNDLSSPSWMWGFDITLDNGLDLISWWGQVDIFTYSYSWAGDPKAIDENLYNSIRTDDIRKEQFAGSYEGVDLLPTNKFYHPNREIGGQRLIETDYIFMRVDEFHLLYAEALAKTAQVGLAKTTLKNYLQTRIADVSYIDGMNQTQLEEEIYKNTRIEFWGEGKSYLALKRNRATVTRGDNHLFFQGQNIPYDDDRIKLSIPQDEVINNPHF